MGHHCLLTRRAREVRSLCCFGGGGGEQTTIRVGSLPLSHVLPLSLGTIHAFAAGGWFVGAGVWGGGVVDMHFVCTHPETTLGQMQNVWKPNGDERSRYKVFETKRPKNQKTNTKYFPYINALHLLGT